MIEATIFDLDGTLVETEELKALSYARAAFELRPELDEAEVLKAFVDVVGLSRREVALMLMQRFSLETAAHQRMAEFGVDTPWQAFVQVRLQLYEALLSDPDVLCRSRWMHNINLLDETRASCQKVGLATMSYCAQVQRVLTILGIQDAFDFVATRDDVDHGKPDPEIYLLVAHELDVE
ncbi:MAG: HAD family phosphatase, partial [Chloroflexota bacterium]